MSVTRLMQRDVEKIREVNCVLARLWAYCLYNADIRPSGWEIMINDYIQECSKYTTPKSAQHLKGNLTKSLGKTTLSWKEFCRGVSILNFDEVYFYLDLVDNDGVKKTIDAKMLPVYSNVKLRIKNETEDDTRFILGYLIRKMHNEFDSVKDNWKDLIKAYAETRHEYYGEDVATTIKTLSTCMSQEMVTWNVFFRGLSACTVFKSIRIGLRYRYKHINAKGSFDLTELKIIA